MEHLRAPTASLEGWLGPSILEKSCPSHLTPQDGQGRRSRLCRKPQKAPGAHPNRRRNASHDVRTSRKKRFLEGVKKSPSPVIPSEARNLHLFVFNGNKCRCFASLSMTANFFTPSWNRFSSPMVAFLQARKLERLPSFLASSLFLTAGGAFKEGKWAEPGERAACRLRRRCRPHCCQPPSEPRRWCSGQRKRVCPGRRSDSRSWRRTPPARSNRG